MNDMFAEEISFDKKVIDKLLENAGKAYPDEGCGVLLSRENEYRVRSVYATNNTSADKGKRDYFSIDPMTMYEVEQAAKKEGLYVLGFYHTHPDAPAVPSASDKENMIPGMIYVILSVWDRKTRGIRAVAKREVSGDAIFLSINVI